MKTLLAMAAAVAALATTHASAAEFNFTFDTTSTGIFGGPTQTIRGTFTTLDTAVNRSGQSGLEITGISGTINGTAISGLYESAGPYYYLISGPTFLDGSGVRFNAGAATNIAFFHQDGTAADTYRVNGNGTISAFGPATSSPAVAGAVPEPATWAMMLVGFGVIGAASRYRRRGAKVTFA